MDETTLLQLLRYDLNRLGARPDDEYLKTLLKAAKRDLETTGITFPDDSSESDIEDYQLLIVGTAAWMYTKRRTGEDMPAYVRRMRNKIYIAQKAGVKDA
jgi:hypothetical protein